MKKNIRGVSVVIILFLLVGIIIDCLNYYWWSNIEFEEEDKVVLTISKEENLCEIASKSFASFVISSSKDLQQYLYQREYYGYPENDDVIHVWAHGTSSEIMIVEIDAEGKVHSEKVTDVDGLDGFDEFLRKNSEIWGKHTEEDQIIIVLHSCETGQGDNSIAQKISEESEFKNTLIVAPTETVVVVASQQSSSGFEEFGAAKTVVNNGKKTVATDKNGKSLYGAWKIFRETSKFFFRQNQTYIQKSQKTL